MKKLLLIYIFIALNFTAICQTDSVDKPKGWKLGGILPDLAYDSDLGFRYGIFASLYDYGDSDNYPNYIQYIFLDVYRTTRGNATNVFIYDTKKFLGSNLRFVSEISYITDQALDFYGFNGADSYFKEYTGDNFSGYKSRMYYKCKREMLRVAANLRGKLYEEMKLKWITGLTNYSINISSVDINKLNESLEPDDILPSTDSIPGLYEQYVKKGIISTDEKSGGNQFLIRLGLMIDKRDVESLPTKGYWSDLFIQYSPEFINNSDYAQLIATHRQYFTLIDKQLYFAYRISANTKLLGDIPFYMLPFYSNFVQDVDGLGSAKTVRGLLRNRLISDNTLFSNIELRWKFLETKIFGQDFYTALGTFFDLATVTFKSKRKNLVPENSRLHLTTGAGLYFALNNNYVVVIDYGRALNENDGDNGIYIHLNWLF